MTGLEMKYFVLTPYKNDHFGVASRNAIITYALVIEKDNPKLAFDLVKWVNEIEEKLPLLKGPTTRTTPEHIE